MKLLNLAFVGLAAVEAKKGSYRPLTINLTNKILGLEPAQDCDKQIAAAKKATRSGSRQDKKKARQALGKLRRSCFAELRKTRVANRKARLEYRQVRRTCWRKCKEEDLIAELSLKKLKACPCTKEDDGVLCPKADSCNEGTLPEGTDPEPPIEDDDDGQNVPDKERPDKGRPDKGRPDKGRPDRGDKDKDKDDDKDKEEKDLDSPLLDGAAPGGDIQWHLTRDSCVWYGYTVASDTGMGMYNAYLNKATTVAAIDAFCKMFDERATGAMMLNDAEHQSIADFSYNHGLSRATRVGANKYVWPTENGNVEIPAKYWYNGRSGDDSYGHLVNINTYGKVQNTVCTTSSCPVICEVRSKRSSCGQPDSIVRGDKVPEPITEKLNNGGYELPVSQQKSLPWVETTCAWYHRTSTIQQNWVNAESLEFLNSKCAELDPRAHAAVIQDDEEFQAVKKVGLQGAYTALRHGWAVAGYPWGRPSSVTRAWLGTEYLPPKFAGKGEYRYGNADKRPITYWGSKHIDTAYPEAFKAGTISSVSGNAIEFIDGNHSQMKYPVVCEVRKTKGHCNKSRTRSQGNPDGGLYWIKAGKCAILAHTKKHIFPLERLDTSNTDLQDNVCKQFDTRARAASIYHIKNRNIEFHTFTTFMTRNRICGAYCDRLMMGTYWKDGKWFWSYENREIKDGLDGGWRYYNYGASNYPGTKYALTIASSLSELTPKSLSSVNHHLGVLCEIRTCVNERKLKWNYASYYEVQYNGSVKCVKNCENAHAGAAV